MPTLIWTLTKSPLVHFQYICLFTQKGSFPIFLTKGGLTSINLTLRKQNEPIFSVSYSCTRMSLKMAEDSEWESCECDTVTASVAVCQHPWNAVDSGMSSVILCLLLGLIPFASL